MGDGRVTESPSPTRKANRPIPQSAHRSTDRSVRQSLHSQLSSIDLEERMQCHDAYFASIIDMIPRDLYKPSEEEASSKYFMHRKLPLTASERKALSKKRKQEVYGSEENKRKKTVGDDDADNDDDVEGGNVDAVGEEEEEDLVEMDDDDVDTTDAMSGDNAEVDIDDGTMLLSKAESIEVLRGRLKEKIKAMQNSRNSAKSDTAGDSSRNQKSQSEKKKARDEKHNKDNGKKNTTSNANTASSSSSKADSSLNRSQSNSSIADDLVSLNSNSSIASPHSGSLDVEMNKLGGVKDRLKASDSNMGKPGTKMKRLKRMLDEANRKRERIQSLKQGGDDDKVRAKQELWNDVLKNASGEKSTVDLDPKKIKKAIKRREKQKQKSADQWSERKTTLEADINKRLDKRDENVKNRKGSGSSMERGDKTKAESAEGKEGGKEGGRKNRFTPYEGNKVKEAADAPAAGGKKSRVGFEGKKPNAFLNNGTGSAGKNPKRS